ncbi:hypothetical protein MMC25_001516 [Agyrium rufum]|nr:hypothetical protein [Agyrium rufum]
MCRIHTTDHHCGHRLSRTYIPCKPPLSLPFTPPRGPLPQRCPIDGLLNETSWEQNPVECITCQALRREAGRQFALLWRPREVFENTSQYSDSRMFLPRTLEVAKIMWVIRKGAEEAERGLVQGGLVGGVGGEDEGVGVGVGVDEKGKGKGKRKGQGKEEKEEEGEEEEQEKHKEMERERMDLEEEAMQLDGVDFNDDADVGSSSGAAAASSGVARHTREQRSPMDESLGADEDRKTPKQHDLAESKDVKGKGKAKEKEEE